ncbi:TetR/AcrR family transcriptional regulator [Arachnia propionica]|uniref:TetR/AcrR family transcriptional regulator n=1 Tax=Arachnia propionica TaxID=1750 RepID=UPI000F6E48F4|nr:TetR/AcrR family transcriptional regulator [Arachnia propionica]VEJ59677.1 HTH-type transcriptional repressor KstR [Arachnia propionica]
MNMQQPMPAPGTSLRERKKTAKQERILEAATRLFAEKGYEAVTTAEIAEAAEVGVGTLFRYAGSKAELLVAVMNSRFAEGIEAGLSEAAEGRAMAESIIAILRPFVEESMTHPENMLAYEREALFGSVEHREEATSSVSRVEQAILQVMLLHRAKPRDPSADLEDIAHTIYAVLYLDIVKVTTGRSAMADLPARVRRSVDFLTGALLKT